MAVEEQSQAVWSARDTTPSEIDAALRNLLVQRHAEDQGYAPARVLNLVAVVEKEWRGEVENRLERVGRYHPSRTIICAVEPNRTTIDAWVAMDEEMSGDSVSVGAERVELTIGEKHLPRLETIVDPLVVPDLSTLVWSPHGYDDAVDSLIGIAQVVLIDSVQAPDPRAAMGRAIRILEDAYVVDLAWLRSAPWRERVAATFDPPRWRAGLREITSVTVRYHSESMVAAMLTVGWLSSRLGWTPARMEQEDGGFVARARTEGRKVRLRLEVDDTMPVPGLAGIAIETASGLKMSLFRGAGGLTATRKLPGGRESSWVVLGASRGEAGILGEGIRQALLRDPVYGPALRHACEMLPS